jgi:hypothetical protein
MGLCSGLGTKALIRMIRFFARNLCGATVAAVERQTQRTGRKTPMLMRNGIIWPEGSRLFTPMMLFHLIDNSVPTNMSTAIAAKMADRIICRIRQCLSVVHWQFRTGRLWFNLEGLSPYNVVF